MTALRPTIALLSLVLACGSSEPLVPADASPSGDGPAADGPAAPDGAAAPDLPLPTQPDATPDLGLASTPDLMSLPEASACMAPAATYGPFAGCAPGPGPMCDLVCQARCGCGQRCLVDSSGPHCQDRPGPFVDLGGTCNNKDDRCEPGLLCLQESADNAACGAHCYRHCRSDGDCSNGARCVIEVQFGVTATPFKVCSPPADTCEPWGTAHCRDQAQRPAPLFGCYVMGSATNSTACECAGTLKVGAACTYEHECEPGAECIVSGATRTCRKICNAELLVGPNPAPCPAPQTCTPFTGSAKYGYCK
jgi:hypothetical protein